ncbi:MAG: AlwI family type II restriction endonuclease [Prevotella sp.]|nr:AlwI family type II restriction endonuclease [Prevotella sp.]
MAEKLSYKSFCWNLGTTSFRTKNFNKSIEEQLALLDEFWTIQGNSFESWNGNEELQIRYYDFLRAKGFITGDARNKAKDAREKTSGLCDIGLIDSNRQLTEPGTALLQISQSGDFTTDNIFKIPKDSFIYLKQLMKLSGDFSDKCVRPFIVLLYLLTELNYLTLDEFTYLLPLCIDQESTELILSEIPILREGKISIDDIIIRHLMNQQNYKDGLKVLINNTVDENLICTIGMNRKSRTYDKSYYPLYQELYKTFVENDKQSLEAVYIATKQINIGRLWRSYLFGNVSEKAIKRTPEECLNETDFSHINNETEFKQVFFETLHLLKAKATLADYMDLNRRYIKTSDIILFDEDTVKIDIVPKQIFKNGISHIYSKAFESSELLDVDCPLEEILDGLIYSEQSIIDGINAELHTNVTTLSEAYDVVESNRYLRLEHLIDTKFTKERILKLLDLFEKRKDEEIKDLVTENADAPTIFEYVLGILWYKVSERKGKILDYLKLSLDADLLPKTHAAGGEADIVYEYEKTRYFPAHTLLLEATLADGTNQRRMEMEPVSRHLGQHLLRTNNPDSYCLFTTNNLNIKRNCRFSFQENYTILRYRRLQ